MERMTNDKARNPKPKLDKEGVLALGHLDLNCHLDFGIWISNGRMREDESTKT